MESEVTVTAATSCAVPRARSFEYTDSLGLLGGSVSSASTFRWGCDLGDLELSPVSGSLFCREPACPSHSPLCALSLSKK